MTLALGTNAVVKVDIASSLTDVEHVKDASFSKTTNAVDSTDNDTAGWLTNLAGNATASFSFTFNYDVTKPTGQTQIHALAMSKAIEEWQFQPDGNVVGADEYDFSGFVSEISQNATNDTTLECVATVTVTGTVTRTTIT
jgi:hypothetical protein